MWLVDLPPDARRGVRRLAPLVRLADAFDASRARATRRLEATLVDGACRIRLRCRNKAKPELKAAARRSDLFRQVYGLEVVVTASRAGPPPGAELLGPALSRAFCHWCGP